VIEKSIDDDVAFEVSSSDSKSFSASTSPSSSDSESVSSSCSSFSDMRLKSRLHGHIDKASKLKAISSAQKSNIGKLFFNETEILVYSYFKIQIN